MSKDQRTPRPAARRRPTKPSPAWVSALRRSAARLSVRWAGDRRHADDVAQAAAARLLAEKFRRPVAGRTLRRHVHVTAMRVFGEAALRPRHRRTRVPLSAVADLPANTPDPSEALQKLQTREQVRAELAKLSDALRTPLQMYYFDGLTAAEVGRSMGISENAVRIRLHRGRRKLRSALAVRD